MTDVNAETTPLPLGVQKFVSPKAATRLQLYTALQPSIAEQYAALTFDAPVSAVANAQQQVHQLQAADDIDLLNKKDSIGTFEAFYLAAQGTTTGYVAQRLADVAGRADEADKNYTFNTQLYYDTLQQYGIAQSDYALQRLSSAENHAELTDYAIRLKEHQDLNRLVGDRAMVQFTVNTLDPVENVAMVAAAATGGFVGAGLSISARAQRLTAAALTGTGLAGAMSLGADSGKEYSWQDVVMGAAVAGGLTYAFTKPRGSTPEPLNVPYDADLGSLGLPSPAPQPPAPTRQLPAPEQPLRLESPEVIRERHTGIAQTVYNELRVPAAENGTAVSPFDTWVGARDVATATREEATGLGKVIDHANAVSTELRNLSEPTAWHNFLPEQFQEGLAELAQRIKDVKAELAQLTPTVKGAARDAREAARRTRGSKRANTAQHGLDDDIAMLNEELRNLQHPNALSDFVRHIHPDDVADAVAAAKQAVEDARKSLTVLNQQHRAAVPETIKQGIARNANEELLDMLAEAARQVIPEKVWVQPQLSTVELKAARQALGGTPKRNQQRVYRSRKNNAPTDRPFIREVEVKLSEDIPREQPSAKPAEPVEPELPPEVHAEIVDNTLNVGQSQRGFFGVSADRIKRGLHEFTRFVAEFERITQGIPELRAYVGRVLEDGTLRPGELQRSAAAARRIAARQADTRMRKVENLLFDVVRERTGISKVRAAWLYDRKYLEARQMVDDAVAAGFAQRQRARLYGEPMPVHSDARIEELINAYAEGFSGSANYAKRSGMLGFVDLDITADYFSRIWSGAAKMHRITLQYGEEAGRMHMARHIADAIRRVPAHKDWEDVTVNKIAEAIVVRARNKANDIQQDFMGQLGTQETGDILAELRKSLPHAEYVHIERKLTQAAQELGSVGYSKSRVEMDLTAEYRYPDGSIKTINDYIDTDMLRVLQNYQHAMSGRGALASVGIGGDDASLATWKQGYAKLLDKYPQLSPARKDNMRRQLEHALSDFTGIRPNDALLSTPMQVGKATASASMLGSTGVLQIGETAVMANRYGAGTVFKHMLKQVPGFDKLLRTVGTDPKLYDDWVSATGLDVANDVRLRQWTHQLEAGQFNDSSLLRYAQGMSNLTPYLTAQKFVLGAQARSMIGLSATRLWHAANGDAVSLAFFQRFGKLSAAHLEQFKQAAVVEGGKFRNVNWGALPDDTLDAVMDTIMRVQDHTLLYARTGTGAAYTRSAVGQLIGQFTSYVSMSYNIILRGTFENEGIRGVAAMFAYQYPAMLISTYLNEARKGNVIDLSDDEQFRDLLYRTFGYTSVLGYTSDLVGLVTDRHSRSLAAVGALQAPNLLWRSFGAAANGDAAGAIGNALGAANAATLTGAIIGSQALVRELTKED